MNSFSKKEKGITLIALVVTIIVLLILAGISISMLTGQNGILNRVAEAREKTEKAQKEETAILSDFETLIENKGESVFNEKAGANRPKLTSGMIPVKYDKEKGSWIICSATDENWYNYTTNKEWANVMLSDGKYNETTAKIGQEVNKEELGSMFVWIPRYAYKITSGYHPTATTTGEVDVKFLIGTTDKSLDNVEIKEYNAETTNNYIQFPDGYVVHPAFTSNVDEGGWDKEIAGIWVAKFEAGYPMQTNEFDEKEKKVAVGATNFAYPTFKGQRYSYSVISIGNAYSVSQNLSKADNPYGLSSKSNSHLMKNSEWGAVAYLAKSDYGKKSEVFINNVSFENSTVNGLNQVYAMTGYSADIASQGTNNVNGVTEIGDILEGTKKSYAWYYTDETGSGTNASTTGNISGIYDMSGGAWECPAAFIASGHANLGQGSSFTKDADGKYKITSTKLATAYPAGGSTSSETDVGRSYPAFGKIYGDAVWETSVGAGSSYQNTSWFNDLSDEDDSSNEPFFIRDGGWRIGGAVGTFAFADHTGFVSNSCSYRAVLAVE